jgi:hypothetical protein
MAAGLITIASTEGNVSVPEREEVTIGGCVSEKVRDGFYPSEGKEYLNSRFCPFNIVIFDKTGDLCLSRNIPAHLLCLEEHQLRGLFLFVRRVVVVPEDPLDRPPHPCPDILFP